MRKRVGTTRLPVRAERVGEQARKQIVVDVLAGTGFVPSGRFDSLTDCAVGSIVETAICGVSSVIENCEPMLTETGVDEVPSPSVMICCNTTDDDGKLTGPLAFSTERSSVNVTSPVHRR